MMFVMTDAHLARIREIARTTGERKMRELGIQECLADGKESSFWQDAGNAVIDVVDACVELKENYACRDVETIEEMQLLLERERERRNAHPAGNGGIDAGDTRYV